MPWIIRTADDFTRDEVMQLGDDVASGLALKEAIKKRSATKEVVFEISNIENFIDDFEQRYIGVTGEVIMNTRFEDNAMEKSVDVTN